MSLGIGDLVSVPDLDAYGNLVVTREPDVREVPDAAAAAAETGLEVPEVTALPRGISGEPVVPGGRRGDRHVHVLGGPRRAGPAARLPRRPWTGARSVSSPARAWPRSGRSDPARRDSSWAAPARPRPFSSGVSFETVRDYLLSLPGMPENVADQLRAFNADGSTLPLPVPADRFTASPESVNGAPATVLAGRDRTMAAVVWVEDGVVTAVAGSLDADEVLSIARGLR